MDPSYRRLFAYDAWGNRVALASFREAPAAPPARALAILGHLVGAGQLWLDRLEGRPGSSEVWPRLTVDECEAGFGKLDAAWTALLDRLGPDDHERTVAYTNTKGERWESRVGDILHHVALHGSYHRGQIALLMRQAGHVPAYTDYIEATRRGYLSE
jgi:uncharacterized damage-inducible protein DinB